MLIVTPISYAFARKGEGKQLLFEKTLLDIDHYINPK